MKTELLYLKDAYLKASEAKILDVEVVNPKLSKLILNQTIFFAEGGGQPSDQGKIVVDGESYKVSQVRLENDEIKHYISTPNGSPDKGNCYLEIDWVRRFKNMQVHTAGHIIDWAVSELKIHNDKVIPKEGNHGKNPSIVYVGKTEEITKGDLQKRVNTILDNNLKIETKFVDKEELEKIALYIFPNLPTNKPLRVVQLEGYKAVPDGGTLVKKTGEIESILIEDIKTTKDTTEVIYKVEFGSKKKEPVSKQDLSGFLNSLKEIDEGFQKEIVNIKTLEMLDQIKVSYLGRKSTLIELLRSLKNLPHTERTEAGKQANIVKNKVADQIQAKEEEINSKILAEELNTEWIDVTQPGKEPNVGSIHPITQMMWKATDIFQKMGFEIFEPTEIDDDFNHFTALNIPEEHPARDMWDTFWTEDGQIAIAHTSTMQNRILSGVKPPVRAIVPGRCFRNEATDASHEHTFYQIEGIYLDKDISLVNLMSTMKEFLEKFLEREVQIKIQPSYFPFVEPGLEILIDWNGKWLEVMPAGMIHPNVLKAANIDPDEYSGFAWGFGLDRLVMIKYGIEDIRHFHSGDLRFLKQF